MDQIKVELQEFMGSDASICNSAWTSTYDKNLRDEKYNDDSKIESLVQRMVKEGHSTPFESVVFRFWFRMPIFIDRQHVTHRIASHNGLSGRYRTLPSDWFRLPGDVRFILNVVKNNYGQYISEMFDEMMLGQFTFYEKVLDECKKAEKMDLISNHHYKRVREILRGVVGTAAMVERTSLFNLRSFANYQRLRNSEHAQKEISIIAQKMLEAVAAAKVCPVAIKALMENDWRI